MKQLLSGQALLVSCCVFYLVWWCAAFRPGRHGTTLASGISLGVAALCGIVGVVCSVRGLRAVPEKHACISGAQILGVGAVVYVILLAVTWFGCKRQVTTELFLIVGWSALELSVLSAVYGGDLFSLRSAVVWGIVVAAAAVISLICYLLYYRMSDKAGYIDGMIPLLLIGIVVAGISWNLYLKQ